MAGVIKREQTASVSAFALQDFEAYARKLVRDAKEEAKRIHAEAVAQAKAEVDRLHAEARAAGEAAGREAGLQQIHAEAHDKVMAETQRQAAQVVAALNAGLAAFEQNKRQLIAQAERGTLELALAIARRVCKHLPELHVDVAIANARHALEVASRAGDLELHVHPEEHAALETWAARFVAGCDRLEHVTVVADPQVGRGGCVVRGRHVAIDATLDTQLDRVATALCGVAPDDAGGGA